MKLKITTSKNLQILAYHKYSQNCLTAEPVIEIPLAFNDWIKTMTEESIREFLTEYVEL